MHTQDIEYQINGKTFVGYLADGSNGKQTAGILVAHEGGGMTGHPKERARMLAELGYVAFAMDTFGETIRAANRRWRVIGSLSNDLADACANARQHRARSAEGAAERRSDRAPPRSASASAARRCSNSRAAAPTSAVSSAFTPALRPSRRRTPSNIRCKVMVCLGAEDPIIPARTARRFRRAKCGPATSTSDADYGNAGHSFTNREVDAMKLPGFAYHGPTDQRSWQAMRNFFDEVIEPV